MRLPKNLFKTVKEYLEFLAYLKSKSFFTVKEISSETGIKEMVLYKQIEVWEREELIEKKTRSGSLGGRENRYKFTQKAKGELKSFSTILSNSLKNDKLKDDKNKSVND